MLGSHVVQRPRGIEVAAAIVEASAAMDLTGAGVLFDTLVDDPASARESLDSFFGSVMVEAASAADIFIIGSTFAADLQEAASAAEVLAAATAMTATVSESRTASSAEDAVLIPGVVTDPNWTSVKLLMGFGGTNGSTGSPGFTDESSAAHGTASGFGNAQIDTALSVFGGSSLKLDGTGDYLTFPDSNDWNLANGLFTIECRIRPTTVTGAHYIVGQWDVAPQLSWILYQNGTALAFNGSNNGTTNNVLLNLSLLAANTWYAVCVDFDGTKYRMYRDGVMVISSTSLITLFNSSNALSIGASNSGTNGFAGNIDELRVTKGVARYASDAGYTVATSAFPRS